MISEIGDGSPNPKWPMGMLGLVESNDPTFVLPVPPPDPLYGVDEDSLDGNDNLWDEVFKFNDWCEENFNSFNNDSGSFSRVVHAATLSGWNPETDGSLSIWLYKRIYKIMRETQKVATTLPQFGDSQKEKFDKAWDEKQGVYPESPEPLLPIEVEGSGVEIDENGYMFNTTAYTNFDKEEFFSKKHENFFNDNKQIRGNHNLILLTDAYKYSHHSFYEENMTTMYSYMESRGGLFPYTTFYGLQMFLKQYLEGDVINFNHIDEADELLKGVFGREDIFDSSKFEHLVTKHKGRLPIRIKAVPEGTNVPVKNVLMTIENTDPECAWLTNFLETLLLQVWYPTTVCTLSNNIKSIVKNAFDETTDLGETTKEIVINFVLNDFGFRGVSSVQSAEYGGSAHLVNFSGSDTTIASKAIKDYYNTKKVYGMSVPATEHSIMTVKGEKGELEMMRRVLEKYPTGIVACVSDSFDIFRACKDYWGTELKDMILSRPATPGNQLVIRPDSGHVINTLKEVLNILFDKFGFTTNSKGYKILPPQVRVIQGDGINLDSIREIYEKLNEWKVSAENLVLGMGGKLLQGVNRDTQNFAFKASYVVVGDEERTVVKSPTEINEKGELQKSFKKSKSGRLKLVKTENGYKTVTSEDPQFDDYEDVMVTVFENGKITKEWEFEEIRERAKKNL